MNRRLKPLTAIFFLTAFAASGAAAQGMNSSAASSGTGSIMVRVSGDDGSPLDEEAEVRVYPSGGMAGAITLMTADGGRAQFNQLAQGEYAVEASAPGYKTTSGEQVNVEGRGMTYDVEIHLERDTSAGTRTTPANAGPILTPKAQKDVDKGTAELKSGDFKGAEADLESALKVAPGNPNVNFLLGYIFLQEKDLKQSETYLTTSYSLDPKNVPTEVALGQLRMEQGDAEKALVLLKSAVAQDPNQWIAHWMIAGIYLRQQKFDDALQEAQEAVQTGKGAADGAQLVLGEALASLGRRDDALQALQAFLREEPNNSGVPRARALIASLDSQAGQTAEPGTTSGAPAGTSGYVPHLGSPTQSH